MSQQYYYSTFSGAELDEALRGIAGAAGAAEAAAAASREAAAAAEDARDSAARAEEFAAQVDSYCRRDSDIRFAPAIELRGLGQVLQFSAVAAAPVSSLKLLGCTAQSQVPSPTAPVFPAVNPQPRVILAGENLWSGADAVIHSGGSCWSISDNGLSFRRGDYQGSAMVYVPTPLPKGQTLRFSCGCEGMLTCVLYADESCGNALTLNLKGQYTFTADRDYPHAVAAVMIYDGGPDTDITDIQAVLGEERSFRGGMPLQVLDPGQDLYGIPVQSVCTKHTYVDAAGQKWFADEVDFDAGVYIQRCFTLSFDGSEAWYLSGSGNACIASADLEPLKNFNTGISAPDNGNCAYMLCSHFQAVPRYGNRPAVYVRPGGTAKGNVLEFVWSDYTGDLEGWKAWFAQQAAAGTPVTMVLGRKTPVETALDPEVRARFLALRTHYGDNLIYNDGSAVVAPVCQADTGLYINSKIAAICAAMVK